MAQHSSNFYVAAADWNAAQCEAAAAALGFNARVLTAAAARPGGEGLDLAVYQLAREAWHYAILAEKENDRMARVLAAQCSYGTGAPLTDEEIERANAAHCRACSSIPCRCGGH